MMDKKTLIVGILLIGAVLIGAFSLGLFKSKEISPQPTNTTSNINTAQDDLTVIRSFMAQPDLELTFVNADLPMPYFRVGKVTKLANGENMEAVEGWTRKVNVYDQKKILNGQCVTYQYHVEYRNHTLTSVSIRGLRPNEVETLKQSGTTCVDSHQMPKISKGEAEAIAFEYLRRTLPNFDQIKVDLVYTQKLGGESHEWLWEDKGYKLPEGLEGRPYSYPTIRMTVNGNRTITYWNTVPLFQN